MERNLNVVILAAGIGSRLRPLTDDIPKCMIKVGEDTIIERILKQLKKFEVENISVLTGHGHQKLANFLAENYPEVNCIYNQDYLNTNNMYSLHLFFKQKKDSKDLIILNADCVYDDEIVKKCIQQPKSCIMADSTTFFEESMKVKVDGQQVKGISKKFDKAENIFTSIDLYKFKKETASVLNEIVEGYINNGDYNQWTEVSINDLLIQSNHKHKVYAVEVKGFRWFEIDTIEDLVKARELFR